MADYKTWMTTATQRAQGAESWGHWRTDENGDKEKYRTFDFHAALTICPSHGQLEAIPSV